MRDDDDRLFRDTFLEEKSEERAHALLVTVTILLIVAVIAIAIMFGFFYLRRSADDGGTVVGTISDKNGEIVIIQKGQDEAAAAETEGETQDQPKIRAQEETAAEEKGQTESETEKKKKKKKKKNAETEAALASAASSFISADPEAISNIMGQYSTASDWGVCVWNEASDQTIYAGDAEGQMYASATISVPILYTAAALLDAGQVTLDTPIVYVNSIGGRGEADPYSREGQIYPLSFYLETMLTYSDNNCMNCLIDFFTLDTINATCRGAGFDSVDLQRMIVAEVTDGSENYISAADLAGMVKDLYSGKYTQIDKAFMEQYFRVNDSDESRTLIGFSSQLGADDIFLNQNGRGDTRYSEAAIVVRGDKALVISVMLRGEYGFAYDEAVIQTADYLLGSEQ